MSGVRHSGLWCANGLDAARLDALSWLVVDLETAGLDPGRHVIREYAACAVSAKREISTIAAWSAEADGPESFSIGLATIAADLRAGSVLVAHNLAFDLSFLAMHPDVPIELVRPDRWLCTLRMLTAPERLDALAARFRVPIEGRHTAAGDARTLAGVLVTLLDRADARQIADVRGLAAVVPPGRHGSSGKRVVRTPEGGWAGVRAELDHVVPFRLVSRAQRDAFRTALRLLADYRAGPEQPVAHDATVAALQGAGITASALDILVAELT